MVQGLAGGIYVPAVTAYIQLLFRGRVRGKAFAIMGAVIGVSSAIGPILGGLLIQAFGNTNGWRLVFCVNLPIGIVALIAAALLLPNSPSRRRPRAGVDFVGLLLLTGALIALLVPLIEGQDQGWPRWTYAHPRRRRRAARAVRPLGGRVTRRGAARSCRRTCSPTRRSPAA